MTNTDPRTNGRSRAMLDALERRVRAAIDKAYKSQPCKSRGDHDDTGALCDYQTKGGQAGDWEKLVKAEAQNERGHRRHTAVLVQMGAEPDKIGVLQGARITLLSNVGRGAQMTEPPPASDFLILRRTAVEAQVIGWLARRELHADAGLVEALELLDYAGAQGVQ